MKKENLLKRWWRGELRGTVVDPESEEDFLPFVNERGQEEIKKRVKWQRHFEQYRITPEECEPYIVEVREKHWTSKLTHFIINFCYKKWKGFYKFFCKEWKDFTSNMIAALALVISIITALSNKI